MDKQKRAESVTPPKPTVEDDPLRQKMIAAIKVNNDAMRKGFMAGIRKGARDEEQQLERAANADR